MTRDKPALGDESNWQPRWVVRLPSGSEVGITLDDGCYVVLTFHVDIGAWKPAYHIPKNVAVELGSLAVTRRKV